MKFRVASTVKASVMPLLYLALLAGVAHSLKVARQPTEAQGESADKWWHQFVAKEESADDDSMPDEGSKQDGDSSLDDSVTESAASDVQSLRSQLAEKDQELHLQTQRSEDLTRMVKQLQGELESEGSTDASVEFRSQRERADKLQNQVRDLQNKLRVEEEAKNSAAANVHADRADYLAQSVRALTQQLVTERKKEQALESKVRKARELLADDGDTSAAPDEIERREQKTRVTSQSEEVPPAVTTSEISGQKASAPLQASADHPETTMSNAISQQKANGSPQVLEDAGAEMPTDRSAMTSSDSIASIRPQPDTGSASAQTEDDGPTVPEHITVVDTSGISELKNFEAKLEDETQRVHELTKEDNGANHSADADQKQENITPRSPAINQSRASDAPQRMQSEKLRKPETPRAPLNSTEKKVPAGIAQASGESVKAEPVANDVDVDDIDGMAELHNLEARLQDEDQRIDELAKDDAPPEQADQLAHTKVHVDQIKKARSTTTPRKPAPKATKVVLKHSAQKPPKRHKPAEIKLARSDNDDYVAAPGAAVDVAATSPEPPAKTDIAQFDDLDATLRDEDKRITELAEGDDDELDDFSVLDVSGA